MDVILLDKIANLGGLGDQVSVKAGYARNYLIPHAKAVMATKANIAHFEARRADLEKDLAAKLASAQARGEKLDGLQVTIASKAGDEGKLFGSIGTRDIARVVTEAGHELSKSEIRLPEGVLRHTGEFDITVSLHPEVDVVVKLNVVGEE